MRVLIVGDIHLKPKIFDRADKILESGQAVRAIQMGDLVDDWGQQHNLALYSRTLQRAIKFHEDHPDTLWVMGNHDLGYWYPELGVKESGHSDFAEGEVGAWFRELRRIGGDQKIMHVIDDVIFTHAGLTLEWARSLVPQKTHWEDEIEYVMNLANDAIPYELWEENSPIWCRPQIDKYEMYPAKLQVVGHTPVKNVGEDNGVLSTDVFSTYQDGWPIGTERFAIVDTEKGTWEIAKEPDHKRIVHDPKLKMFIEFFEKETGANFVDVDTNEIITIEKEKKGDSSNSM